MQCLPMLPYRLKMGGGCRSAYMIYLTHIYVWRFILRRPLGSLGVCFFLVASYCAILTKYSLDRSPNDVHRWLFNVNMHLAFLQMLKKTHFTLIGKLIKCCLSTVCKYDIIHMSSAQKITYHNYEFINYFILRLLNVFFCCRVFQRIYQ